MCPSTRATCRSALEANSTSYNMWIQLESPSRITDLKMSVISAMLGMVTLPGPMCKCNRLFPN